MSKGERLESAANRDIVGMRFVRPRSSAPQVRNTLLRVPAASAQLQIRYMQLRPTPVAAKIPTLRSMFTDSVPVRPGISLREMAASR